MNKRKVIASFCLLVGLFSVGMNLFVLSPSANATITTTSNKELYKKTMLNGVRQCYNGSYTYLKKTVTRFNGVNDLMTGDGKADGRVKVPTQIGNTLNDADLSCAQLFNGYNGILGGKADGLLKLYNRKADNITDFGYEGKGSSSESGKYCIWYKYRYKNSKGEWQSAVTSNKICFKTSGNNRELNLADFETLEGGKNDKVYIYFDGGYRVVIQQVGGSDLGEFAINISNATASSLKKSFEESGGSIANATNAEGYNLGYEYVSTEDSYEAGESFNEYTLTSTKGKTVREFLTGQKNKTWGDYHFSEKDKYSILIQYYNSVLKDPAEKNKLGVGDCRTTKNNMDYAINIEGKWCELSGVENVTSGKYNIVSDNNYTLKTVQFPAVVKALMNINYSDPSFGGQQTGPLEENGVIGTVTDTTGEEEGEEATSTCFNSGGALGWVMCPLIKGFGEAIKFLYGWIADNFLEVQASSFATNGPVYQGWAIFRDLANIIFAILFVIVILSQVTGVGISNYGIKKSLPRLIMVVALINISFIVCQLAVDVSNVVATSIYSLFADNEGIFGTQPFSARDFAEGILATLIEVSAASAGIYAIVSNWGAVLPFVLLALLVCVISIVFFFILLAARQAAVILLVVIAPVAVVCYALPGTKKLAERWYKMLSGALLVYPICSLLMGGGQFAGGILSAVAGSDNGDTGLFFQLVAALVSVVPFFFVPTILKSSFAAMGNLGAKISGFGDRLSRSMVGGLRHSEAFRDWQRQRMSNDARRSAMRYANGRGLRSRASRAMRGVGLNGAADRLDAAHRRSAARNFSMYRKTQLENEEAALQAENMDPASIEAARTTMRKEYRDKRINDLANLMAYGNETYTDSSGATQTINAKDVGSLQKAHAHYLRQAEATADAKAKQDLIQRAQATQQLLWSQGDTGRTKAVQNLANHAFGDGSAANPGYGKSDVMKAMGQHISDNAKWMAGLKNEDPGSFEMVGDIVGNGALKDRDTYEQASSSKIRASSVGDLSDNFFESLEKQLAAGNITSSELQAYDKIFTDAMTNPQVAKDLKNKPDNTRVINAIRRAAHDARQRGSGMSKTDYEAKFGAFQSLNPGDELRVPHPRLKIPTDWVHNATTGQWMKRTGTTFVPLTPEDEAYLKTVIEHNAKAQAQDELDKLR